MGWRRSLRHACGNGKRLARAFATNLSREPVWAIGIRTGPSPLSLSPPDPHCNPALTAADITDVSAESVADPFLVRASDRWHLFFEVMPRRSGCGAIGRAESVDGVRWRYGGLVLREPFHVSYPHVFAWKGDYYMTPETLEPQALRLYRACRFPDCWEHVADLIPGRHADPTVFCTKDGWWIISCTAPQQHDTLRLFHAPSPAGPWSEHRASPIVAGDCRVARPAGRVVVCNGEILRFAQDCKLRYGHQVRALRITTLTPTEYREEPALSAPVLAPGIADWSRRGMHHIDAQPRPEGGWLAAVDGCR
jgi:hypothetical protein